MKRYSKKGLDEWFVATDVVMTNEQIDILKNGTQEQKDLLIEQLKVENQPKIASLEESEYCELIYNKFKPVIAESDIYKLISFNFTGQNEAVRGAYNYSLNGNINNVILK